MARRVYQMLAEPTLGESVMFNGYEYLITGIFVGSGNRRRIQTRSEGKTFYFTVEVIGANTQMTS